MISGEKKYADLVESTRGVSGRDWTRVRRPATTLQEAMTTSIPNIDPVLYKGIKVLKITAARGTWTKRILTLSSDNLALFCTHKPMPTNSESVTAKKLPKPFWTPTRGFSTERYMRHIDVGDLDGVHVGVIGTQTLEEAQINPLSKKALKYHEHEIVTVYRNGYRQSLNVVVENKEHRGALVYALNAIYEMYHGIHHFVRDDALLLRYIWYDVDSDKNGLIDKKEFNNICHRINLPNDSLGDDIISDFFADRTGLRYSECMDLLQLCKQKITGDEPNVWKESFGDGTTGISPKTLREKFLYTTQGEKSTSKNDAQALIESMNRLDLDAEEKSANDDVSELDKAHFDEFLFSERNDAFDPAKCELEVKLNMPISHYWINTSHNTYLTGDQLQSKSSVEAYTKALLRGCKCLELDCWDGESSDNNFVPVVFHGHTLTSKIKFRDILLVVQNYLEKYPSTYPIILSLENHCSHPFQRTMAKDLTEIFGSKLFVPKSGQISKKAKLPSPEEMRGMIVIKGKRPPELDSDDDKTVEDEVYSWDGEEPNDDGEDKEKKEKKKSKIVPELAKLTLFHGTKHKTFQESMGQAPSHMHSIGETKITKLVNKTEVDNASLWRKYNVNHMTRTYPAGTRVDSSNYNPILAWAMGCQLVALNFQTHDSCLLLNDGLFRQANGCGYVLKPASLMGGSAPKPVNIKIEVLSG